MKKVILLSLFLLALMSLTAAVADINTDYVSTLFDQSKPIEINIIMSDEDWNFMVSNSSTEEYRVCNMEVNGVLYENVAIRPKGNSSMASVTSSGSQRYSWRVKFDKYEKKRTCDGLDVLILNNGFKDPGELREAVAYDMYAFLDADASLSNYAIVYVNGEYFGCYLALEGVDKSFAKRNYGKDYGELYKPDISGKKNDKKTDAAAGTAADDAADGTAAAQPAAADDGFAASFGGSNGSSASGGQSAAPSTDGNGAPSTGGDDRSGFGASDGRSAAPSAGENAAPSTDGKTSRPEAGGNGGFSIPGGFNFPGGFTMGSGSDGSADPKALNYVGDDLSDYQDIWDAEKFSSTDEDHARVVEALKNVCSGTNITDYIDVDNILKYMAIQTFIYNHDGLTGTVSHNYYLYEEKGKLNLIPWDMNEAFTVSGNGSDYVNFPIDTPFAVTDLSQRSFFMAILSDEECLAKYHEYLRQLSEEYVMNGALEATLSRIEETVGSYVQQDPTSFATYEQYESVMTSLKSVLNLRAQSVLGQIAGEIPSTRDGQSAEPDKLLSTDGADLTGLTSGYGMSANIGGMGAFAGFNFNFR